MAGRRLIDIWNSIPGNTAVKKFQDRRKAVARIWTAIQPLAGNPEPRESKAASPKQRGKEAKSTKVRKGPERKSGTKASGQKLRNRYEKAAVIAMMERPKGVTLAEIMKVTSWQAYTVRGFVSILGSKNRQKIESSKDASGERTYRIAN